MSLRKHASYFMEKLLTCSQLVSCQPQRTGQVSTPAGDRPEDSMPQPSADQKGSALYGWVIAMLGTTGIKDASEQNIPSESPEDMVLTCGYLVFH